MKAMCIKKDLPAENHPDLIAAVNRLTVGEIYTIIDECNKGYELAEFPHPWKIYWNKSCFAPLSDIDETELVKEREQELIYH